MENKKKILVIDDSAFMRRVISDIINNDERCQVIGTAANGKEGLEKIRLLRPDVVTLDIEMPIMNGLQMLKELPKKQMLPVIMMSTLAEEGATETIQALELGAYDFVKKPDNIFKVNSEEIRKELIQKIIVASQADLKNLKKVKPLIAKAKVVSFSKELDKSSKRISYANKLVAIGTSTGGPRALQYVLPYLPRDINAGIVVVQHMPPGFTKSLSDRLNLLSEIVVKEAEDGDVIQNGHAYIAPGDRHMEVIEQQGHLKISLNDGPIDGGHKPSVNVMMNSIAKIKSKSLVGVIMTGMGADGASGMQNVREMSKMHIIAQNEDTCVVYGMPKSVVNLGIADEVLPLEKISESIVNQTGVL